MKIRHAARRWRALLRALSTPPARAGSGHRWLPRSRFLRDVVLHLAVGGLVLVVLQLAPEWRWLATKEDQALDWIVAMHAGVSPERFRGVPQVFVDIDEPTYRAWGEPFHVPRDRLARLIEVLVEAGARIVLVDVDLSRRAGPEDAALERLLAGSVREGPISDGPQIILARTFRDPWPPGSRPWREQRRSFLDPLVDGAPDVHWASTLFLLEPDREVRRFRNLEPTCNGTESEVVPAMQLLATALVIDRDRGVERLRAALERHAPGCEPGARPVPAPDATLFLGDLEIALRGDRVSNRILYDFGARGPAPLVAFDGRRVPLVTRVPARLLLESGASVDPGLLRGRIAVIGASYADSRDLHPTPLGIMPGAMILQNAIHSLLQNGGLKPPGPLVVLGVQILLLLLVTLALSAVSAYWAAWVAMPVTFTVLLFVSFWLFQSGAWLDLAIPLGVVQILVIARRTQERYSRVREELDRLRGASSAG